jgi:F-type H+-transporting ATPase subunit epsilon
MELKIFTLDGTKFEGQVSQVSLPTKDGEITILKGHIPLITILHKGVVRTARLSSPAASANGGQEKENIEIDGGVAEIDGEKVVVLAN